jgi:hypothetical protein
MHNVAHLTQNVIDLAFELLDLLSQSIDLGLESSLLSKKLIAVLFGLLLWCDLLVQCVDLSLLGVEISTSLAPLGIEANHQIHVLIHKHHDTYASERAIDRTTNTQHGDV